MTYSTRWSQIFLKFSGSIVCRVIAQLLHQSISVWPF